MISRNSFSGEVELWTEAAPSALRCLLNSTTWKFTLRPCWGGTSPCCLPGRKKKPYLPENHDSGSATKLLTSCSSSCLHQELMGRPGSEPPLLKKDTRSPFIAPSCKITKEVNVSGVVLLQAGLCLLPSSHFHPAFLKPAFINTENISINVNPW